MTGFQIFSNWLWHCKLRTADDRFMFFVAAVFATLLVFGLIGAGMRDARWIQGALLVWATLFIVYFLAWCGSWTLTAYREFMAYYKKERERAFEILRR